MIKKYFKKVSFGAAFDRIAVAKGQCAYNGRLIPGGEYVCFFGVTDSADYDDREEKWKGLPPSTT